MAVQSTLEISSESCTTCSPFVYVGKCTVVVLGLDISRRMMDGSTHNKRIVWAALVRTTFSQTMCQKDSDYRWSLSFSTGCHSNAKLMFSSEARLSNYILIASNHFFGYARKPHFAVRLIVKGVQKRLTVRRPASRTTINCEFHCERPSALQK